MKDVTPEHVQLKLNEYWHGGSYKGGPPLHSMYVCKSLKAARSYVDMANDRGIPGSGLQLIRVNLVRGAIPSTVMHAALDVGIDNEGNTPASVFDPQLHGVGPVRALVYKLMGQGFDHAVNLEDIGYGIQHEFNATVLFRNSNPKLVKTFTEEHATMKLEAASRLREIAAKRYRTILKVEIPQKFPGTTAELDGEVLIVKGPKDQLKRVYKEYHTDGNRGQFAVYQYPDYISINGSGRPGPLTGLKW